MKNQWLVPVIKEVSIIKTTEAGQTGTLSDGNRGTQS